MPYTKQNFKKKQTLKAEQLNHMEQGISDAMEKAEKTSGLTEEAKKTIVQEVVEQVVKQVVNGNEVAY